MSRGLSSDIKTQLASTSFVMAHLVKLEFNTTYYYTDFSSDIVDGSDTYSANGFLQKIGSISETASLTIGSLSLSLSGVNQTLISDLLGNGHIHRQITIKRAFINASTNALIESFSIYSGRVESMDLADNDKTSVINLRVANQWGDFARLAGRTTSSGSQNQFFPNDKGFDFITQSNTNYLDFGKKTIFDLFSNKFKDVNGYKYAASNTYGDRMKKQYQFVVKWIDTKYYNDYNTKLK